MNQGGKLQRSLDSSISYGPFDQRRGSTSPKVRRDRGIVQTLERSKRRLELTRYEVSSDLLYCGLVSSPLVRLHQVLNQSGVME